MLNIHGVEGELYPFAICGAAVKQWSTGFSFGNTVLLTCKAITEQWSVKPKGKGRTRLSPCKACGVIHGAPNGRQTTKKG